MLEQGQILPVVAEHHWQPLGLIPARSYRERHQRTPPEQRGETLMCQFFSRSTRGCSIYKYRPSECRSYFCEGMTPGHTKKAEDGFAVETQFAQRALLVQGFSYPEIHRQIDVLNFAVLPESQCPLEMMVLYRRAWASTKGHKDVGHCL
jgi:Fe-S-cluster containining protein